MKKNEEDLVKELFKNRNEIISSFCEKINKVYDVQSKKLYFSEQKSKVFLSRSGDENFVNIISNVRSLKSFSWKINVTISNNNSIRV
jgi:hypothetical protein